MSSHENKRQELLAARRQEKLKWMILNEIMRQREASNLLPINMNDPAVDNAARITISQNEPQMTAQGYSIQAQFQELTPVVNLAIAEIAGGVVNGGALTDTKEQAYQRMMGQQIKQPMPYNAGANEGDPYAALMLHQAQAAEVREAQLAEAETKRRKEQNEFLKQQIELKVRLQKEAKEKQIRLELLEQEKHNEWTRQENIKNNQKEVARRREYQRIMEFQKEHAKKVEEEKVRIMAQDQMFLQNIAAAQEAADAKEIQEQIKWKAEARKTKLENDKQLGRRAEMARLEVEKDKERIRMMIQIQKENDARRKADLEATKRHQEHLTNLGEKAAEAQAAADARIEAQIHAAIERDEIKRNKKEKEKAAAKQNFLLEQRLWKEQEDERRKEETYRKKQAELEEVNRIRLQAMNAEKLDAKLAAEKKIKAQEMNYYLKQQMAERVERDRVNKVAMSPAELAMNATILSQFSPARRPVKDTSNMFARAGNNVIF